MKKAVKDYTAVINGRFAGSYHSSQAALDGLRGIIKPGEVASIYYEVPHSHIIGQVEYEDVQTR
jgi:hypothetical protein